MGTPWVQPPLGRATPSRFPRNKAPLVALATFYKGGKREREGARSCVNQPVGIRFKL
jgi:hypothetical protein